MTNEEISDHIVELYRRQHESNAEISALKLLLCCLVEQLQIDRAQFLDIATRTSQQIAKVMERDGMPEQLQELQRQTLNSTLAMLLKAVK